MSQVNWKTNLSPDISLEIIKTFNKSITYTVCIKYCGDTIIVNSITSEEDLILDTNLTTFGLEYIKKNVLPWLKCLNESVDSALTYIEHLSIKPIIKTYEEKRLITAFKYQKGMDLSFLNNVKSVGVSGDKIFLRSHGSLDFMQIYHNGYIVIDEKNNAVGTYTEEQFKELFSELDS